MMTYSNLRRRTLSGELVLRIHHASSASPLIWTGDLPTSGFSAPQASFNQIPPPIYNYVTEGLEHTDWLSEADTRNQMIDHILDRRSLPPAPDPMNQDIEMMVASPFISVTTDLDWALYWVAHQLAGTSVAAVHIAVIRRPAPVAPRAYWHTADPSTAGKAKEVFVKPFIDDPVDVRGGMSEREKHNYLSAKGKAAERKEWFFYGRIFGDSVAADLVFTQHVSLS